MERRLAILQKRSHSKYDISESESPQHLATNTSFVVDHSGSLLDAAVATVSTPRARTHRDSVVRSSEKHFRSRSNSNDHISRTGRSSRVSSHAGTPTPQDDLPIGFLGKRNAKRKLNNSVGLETTSKKKKTKQNEIQTTVEYTGLELPIPHLSRDWNEGGCVPPQVNDRFFANHLGGGSRRSSKDLPNSVPSPSASGHSGDDGKEAVNGNEETIVVPLWRTNLVQVGGANGDGVTEVGLVLP